MKTKEEYAEATLDGANACKEHHSGIEMQDVASVVAAFEGCSCEWDDKEPCDSWCDREGAAVLILKDGRIASVWENEDVTGHG